MTSIALVFFGNQYLPQSKKTSLKSLLCGGLARSFGCVTMLECMRQFAALTGARNSKDLLLLSQNFTQRRCFSCSSLPILQ
uniref:Uncharacterized protein n=1 Tax=Lotus japonicus TaxID=34305 RepID=I3S394_LOTJA|nr:unknown [Lotus japonicus]